MANFADEPLTRITINLFAKDVRMLQEIYDEGYQVEIRKIVRGWLKEYIEVQDEN